jgi:HKD family nuclease
MQSSNFGAVLGSFGAGCGFMCAISTRCGLVACTGSVGGDIIVAQTQEKATGEINMELIIHPFGDQTLGVYLKELLADESGAFHTFQAAVAFAKISGVQHIREELHEFVMRGSFVRMVIGIDLHGTSQEALSALMNAVGEGGEIWINHDETQFVSFHPKVYLFEGEQSAILIIGSGNLTQGGLFTNDEASGVYSLDADNPADMETLAHIKSALDNWCNPQNKIALLLNESFLEKLVAEEYVLPEAALRPEIATEAAASDEGTDEDRAERKPRRRRLFGRLTGRKRPPRRVAKRPKVSVASKEKIPVRAVQGFVMTLMKTDVGTGQTTPDTSRRSPEIFIPLTARNMFPEFWCWPDSFVEDQRRENKFDRRDVKMRLGGEIINVNMMTWPVKHDFRLRSEALRSAGQIGDIFRIECMEPGGDYEYYVEIIPQGTSGYNEYLARCTNKTSGGSKRVWGYYGVAETED